MFLDLKQKELQAKLYKKICFIAFVIVSLPALVTWFVLDTDYSSEFVVYQYVFFSGLFGSFFYLFDRVQNPERLAKILFVSTLTAIFFIGLKGPAEDYYVWLPTTILFFYFFVPSKRDVLFVNILIPLSYLATYLCNVYVKGLSAHEIGLRSYPQFVEIFFAGIGTAYITYEMAKSREFVARILFEQALAETSHTNEDETNKYKSSPLKDGEIEQISSRILNFFETSDVYLNPEFDLSGLSRVLKLPKYQVSQIINLGLEINFCELIAKYRVEQAKKRLLDVDNQHLTILAIANDVGFSSKSSFNTAFKKFTGQTPSKFRGNLDLG